jgi:hypothetical protein
MDNATVSSIKQLHKAVCLLLLELQAEIGKCLIEGRTEARNPQMLYIKTKKKIIATIKKHTQRVVPKVKRI